MYKPIGPTIWAYSSLNCKQATAIQEFLLL